MACVIGTPVDQTNDERTTLITHIKQLGRRQRGMGDTTARLGTESDTLPPVDRHRVELVGAGFWRDPPHNESCGRGAGERGAAASKTPQKLTIKAR